LLAKIEGGVVELLLEAGVIPTGMTIAGGPALSSAIILPHAEVVQILLSAHADFFAISSSTTFTPLRVACWKIESVKVA
jgi:hypothetical protein